MPSLTRFWTRNRSVCCAVIVGFILRAAWWVYARPAPVSDFEYYRRLAENFLATGPFGSLHGLPDRVPAYPMFLAAAMSVSRSVSWLSFTSVILSTMLIVVLWRLAVAALADRPAAATAAWLAAVNPTFVFFSPILASEHLFALLLFGSVLPLIGRTREGRSPSWAYARAGAILGAATLTRPDALFYLPVHIAMSGHGQGLRARGLAIAALLAGVVVLVVPWVVRSETVRGPGAGLSTMGGINFYYAHNDTEYGWHPLQGTGLEALPPAERQRRAYQLGFEYLARSGATKIINDIVTGTGKLYSTSDAYAVFWSTRLPGGNPDESSRAPLAGADLFTRLTRLSDVVLAGALLSVLFVRRIPARGRIVLYGVVLANWIGYAWVFWANARFRYAAEGACCVLAAITGRALGRWLMGRPMPQSVNGPTEPSAGLARM